MSFQVFFQVYDRPGSNRTMRAGRVEAKTLDELKIALREIKFSLPDRQVLKFPAQVIDSDGEAHELSL